MDPRLVQMRLTALGEQAGVSVTPAILRHTFARQLVLAHVSLEQVAARLGVKAL